VHLGWALRLENRVKVNDLFFFAVNLGAIGVVNIDEVLGGLQEFDIDF
jgi:hypothetical protein